MNIMCGPDGVLLALLDWGDAGWGDPALDFASVPLDMMSCALDGYGPENRKRLGAYPEARFIWDRLHNAMDDALENPKMDDVLENPKNEVPVADYRRYLELQ
jgi:aminoglycoside phosphotransferase (APT) family kinase protein